MTEVLFGLSAAFIGYVIYVLVDEQMAVKPVQPVAIAPEKTTGTVKANAPKAVARKTTRVKKTKSKVVNLSNVPEQVGMAAGSVYRYLRDNGSISVTKLVHELKEDSKTIQRSIGWLAQEGKITLEMVNRVEMIKLS